MADLDNMLPNLDDLEQSIGAKVEKKKEDPEEKERRNYRRQIPQIPDFTFGEALQVVLQVSTETQALVQAMESGIEDVGLMKEVTQHWILRLLLGTVQWPGSVQEGGMIQWPDKSRGPGPGAESGGLLWTKTGCFAF